MTDVDQYALQKSLFGGTDTETHNKAYREELHAREKDQIPNPNVNPGQYAPKGGRNPLLKVVQHATGWTASTMLPGGKEFRVEGHDRQHAISQAIRAGEKMGHVFDPPKAEPEIGGLFHGGQFDEKQHPREATGHGTKHAGEFAPKHQAALPQSAEAPFVLQRPKKNRAVATFDNNANTKQNALFDTGKKGELPGQSLLFNSDAGDMHNPRTMENKVVSSDRDVESIHKMAPGANARLKHERLSHEQGINRLAESNRFNETLITIAADDITKLRKQDVDRVLRSCPPERQGLLESWIIKRRPDLAEEVNTVSQEMDAEKYPHMSDVDQYSRRVYEQFEHETERYLRDYTLYDVDRYGIGGKIMKTLLAFMAMHAMGHLMGNKSQAGPQQEKPAATAGSSPSNQDFEKLHPREAVQGGNHKPGQFAKKPAGASAQAPQKSPMLNGKPVMSASTSYDGTKGPAPGQKPPQRPAPVPASRKESVLSSTLHHDPKQIEREQQAADMKNHLAGVKSLQPIFKKKAAEQARSDKAAERDAAKEAKKNPDWLKQAADSQARAAAKPKPDWAKGGTPAPTTPIQEPQDRHTAKVAEIWHGKPEPTQQVHRPGGPAYQGADTASSKHWFPYNGAKPTVESFTDEVLQHYAGKGQEAPAEPTDERADKLPTVTVGKQPSPAEQEPFVPEYKKRHAERWAAMKAEKEADANQPAIADVMRNPAAEARKAKAESDKRTAFDPTEFGAGVEEQPEAPKRQQTIQDHNGDYDALDAAKKDRAKSVKANRDWEKKTNENPDENIASVAADHEIDHEPFSKYANEMQAFEQEQWKKHRDLQAAVRKHIGSSSYKRQRANAGAKGHEEHHDMENSLRGNIPHETLVEHFGHDTQDWDHKAYELANSPTPPKPGAHDRDWLDNHAKAYKRLQSLHQPEVDPADYPEPEDGAPFSNRSLALAADRYFRQFRSRQNQNSLQNWTILDQWV